MFTTNRRIPALRTVGALVILVGALHAPYHANAATASGARHIVSNAALGVTLTVPSTERLAPNAARSEFDLVIPGRVNNPIRLVITSLGTTRDPNATRAAAAGMAALLRGVKTSAARIVVRYGGAPGVQASGIPSSPGPVTVIVLVHAGDMYKILAPGANLAPDQRQALASLRFSAPAGAFPPSSR